MELEVPNTTIRTPSLLSKGKESQMVEEKPAPKVEEKVQKKQEENHSILNNPTRIAEKQKQHITFVAGRYTPVLPNRKIGICFLRDAQPAELDAYLGQPLPAQKMDV